MLHTKFISLQLRFVYCKISIFKVFEGNKVYTILVREEYNL